MPDLSPVDVLVAHQRHGSHACLCGFDILGYSHCQHQLDALAAAGYTVTPARTEWGLLHQKYGFLATLNDDDTPLTEENARASVQPGLIVVSRTAATEWQPA